MSKPARLASALARWQRGDLLASEHELRSIIEDFSGDRQAAYYLASLLRQTGRVGEAILLLGKVIAERGAIPALQRELRAAEEQSQSPAAPSSSPVIPKPIAGGPMAGGAGPGAISGAGEPPSSPGADAAYRRGMALRERMGFAESLDAFERGLEEFPDDPRLLVGAGSSLSSLGRQAEAARMFLRAIELRPRMAPAMLGLADALKQEGRFDQAIEWYRKARERRPELAAPAVGEAEALDMAGRVEEALEAASEARARWPDDALGAVVFADLARRSGRVADAIAALEPLADRPLPMGVRARVLFALGSALESAGRYDDAFSRFSQGNALYDPALYRSAEHVGEVDELIRVFSPAFLRERAGWGDPSDIPVFVLGMPRSGTTLVEQIIASHPMAHGAGELPDIARLAQKLGVGIDSRSYPARAPAIPRPTLAEAARVHVERLGLAGRGARRVVDKMPHNYLHIGLISILFPSARILHCVRDPMDTCASCLTMLFSPQHAYTADQHALASAYRQYRRIMDHWRSALPGRILDVEYEALTADPEPRVRAILDHCGLSWHEGCLHPERSSRVAMTPSMFQVRQPINRGSVGRWKRYEKHLGVLREELAPFMKS